MSDTTSFKNTLREALNYVKETIDADLAMKNIPIDDNCKREISKIYSMKFIGHLELWNVLVARGIGHKETLMRKSALQSLCLELFPHKIPENSLPGARDFSKLVYSKSITYDEITNALDL